MAEEPGEGSLGGSPPEETPGKGEGPENIEALGKLQEMVAVIAGGIEDRLAGILGEAIEGITAKNAENVAAANELVTKAKTAIEAVPGLIQEHVEAQLKVNLKGIVEEVGNQFEAKMRAMAGGSAGTGDGMSIGKLLDHSDKIIGVINAWKQPTTDQAMLGQMNLVMKWHSLLSKLEKGGGTGDEVTRAIADTFKEKE